jgi:two-component system NarL family response regulator
MRFLIVDDSANMRSFLASLISDLADEIHECADGVDAVACYSAKRPDWVLMDIDMPRMDGITATRQIRADFPAARIIIITVHDKPAMRQAAGAAGACAYVSKRNLLEVRQILEDRHQ